MPAGLFDTAGQEPLDHADGQDAEGRYRAVAGTAIAAAVAAALSPLAFLDWSMVVVPLLGVVLGTLAYRTITQRPDEFTGRPLAIGAIVVSAVSLIAGLVTLSGGGARRILYMNTCDEAQVWTTPNCDNQDHPRLTLQNITFIDGDSRADEEFDGGGALFVRGGRLKLVNTRFFNNRCADVGADVGGGGVRVFDQFDDQPVFAVNTTFGGAEGFGNTCANGGGVSSIGVSWTFLNSLLSFNHAIGNGGNPAQDGTPGGGSGGAIYNDGNRMTLNLCGTRIENNDVVQHGSAIFFVSNDHSGDVRIDRGHITNNVGGSWYPTYDQISGHEDTPIAVTNSVIGDQTIP